MDFFSKTIDTNAKGTFSFCQHFIRHIVAARKLDEDLEAPTGGYAIVCVQRPLKIQDDTC